jgi:hypothetical protein
VISADAWTGICANPAAIHCPKYPLCQIAGRKKAPQISSANLTRNHVRPGLDHLERDFNLNFGESFLRPRRTVRHYLHPASCGFKYVTAISPTLLARADKVIE